MLCPITSQVKGYPFEVAIPSDLDVSGVVLADQIKSLDWRARKAKRFAGLPSEVMSEILGKVQTLVS